MPLIQAIRNGKSSWLFCHPKRPGGRLPKHRRRVICNAIIYVAGAGCAWHLLPRSFPHGKIVYGYFRPWRLEGVWQRIHDRLRSLCRRRAGRPACPTAGIIDSQNIKTADRGGIHGYDGGKKINLAQGPSSRRHLGPCALRTGAWRRHRGSRRSQTPFGSGRGTLCQAASTCGRMRAIAANSWSGSRRCFRWRVEVVKKPSRWGRYPESVEPPPLPAFTVLKRRWVVARTFAWLGHYRRLSKDEEFLPETEETLIYLAMSRLDAAPLLPPGEITSKIHFSDTL